MSYIEPPTEPDYVRIGSDAPQDAYLSEAVEAFRKEFFDVTGDRLNGTVVGCALRAAESHFATHYEQKWAGKTQTLAAELETQVETTRELQRQLLAAEQKGAEEERQRLKGEIAHFRELGEAERRNVERAEADSLQADRFFARATVYEYVVDRLRKLAALSQKETDQPGEESDPALFRERAVNQLLEMAPLAHDEVMRAEFEGLASRLSYPPRQPRSGEED